MWHAPAKDRLESFATGDLGDSQGGLCDGGTTNDIYVEALPGLRAHWQAHPAVSGFVARAILAGPSDAHFLLRQPSAKLDGNMGCEDTQALPPVGDPARFPECEPVWGFKWDLGLGCLSFIGH